MHRAELDVVGINLNLKVTLNLRIWKDNLFGDYKSI